MQTVKLCVRFFICLGETIVQTPHCSQTRARRQYRRGPVSIPDGESAGRSELVFIQLVLHDSSAHCTIQTAPVISGGSNSCRDDQPVGRRYWVRRDGKGSTKVPETTATMSPQSGIRTEFLHLVSVSLVRDDTVVLPHPTYIRGGGLNRATTPWEFDESNNLTPAVFCSAVNFPPSRGADVTDGYSRMGGFLACLTPDE
jgi:hypothetical protein